MGYLTRINNIYQVNGEDIYNVNFPKISPVSIECNVVSNTFKNEEDSNGG